MCSFGTYTCIKREIYLMYTLHIYIYIYMYVLNHNSMLQAVQGTVGGRFVTATGDHLGCGCLHGFHSLSEPSLSTCTTFYAHAHETDILLAILISYRFKRNRTNHHQCQIEPHRIAFPRKTAGENFYAKPLKLSQTPKRSKP